MISVSNYIFNIFVFLSVYVQVFFLVTFFENRKKISVRSGETKLTSYPAVTIVVPCWNEEKTVSKTVESLLALNYPKDKLKIYVVDDGSTDNTWQVIKTFEKYPNIEVFTKKNGGKYNVLNMGLEKSNTEFFGALDADSFVDPNALTRIMTYFEKDETVMAVAPSVAVYNPTNFVQNAQKVEYNMGVYFKKMLAFLGGINVTPGPFTIFKKKVFIDLGPYRHGHNTEDMEIAYRMQKNNYKIEHCNDAYVYTNTPATIKKLYKQRLRWVYGFINNTFDYKNVLFKKKYGNFALFTLPMGVISIISVFYLFSRMVINLFLFIYSKIISLHTTGLHLNNTSFHFDWFFINIHSFIFLIICVYFLIFSSMLLGRKMTEGKWGFSIHMLYFFPVFSIIAPFWIMKAVYNSILARKPAWR